MRQPRPATWLTSGLLLLLLVGTAPLSAYTIFLKDGSQLVAREKYTVDGDRAIITLPSGTQTFLTLSEIDIQRTEKANESNLGTAVLVEGSGATELASPQPPPDKKTTLGDLITSRQATARIPRSDEPTVTPQESTGVEISVPRTEAGYADLAHWQRLPLTNTELVTQIAQLYRNQGIEEVEIHQGTRRGRVLVDLITNSEASIFQALEVSAAVVLQLLDRYPDRFDGLELYFNTYRREPAGQFFLDRNRARMLATKSVDLPTFFLSYVEF